MGAVDDQLAINAIRMLSIEAVEEAQSGHAGAPMALAPLAWSLWTKHMRHDPNDPTWPDRDRFVLSVGHASMLLYSLLHLTGYDVSLEELSRFRQLGSATPGHPEYGDTPGVETTTGPLGQGVGNAVGMALAEAMLAARFNTDDHTVVDHRTWVFASDGDMMEGVAAEAASLAGQLKLGKLVVFYDNNEVTIDGHTDISLSVEDTPARFAAYGWRVLHLEDANDLELIDKTITEAAAGDGRPTFVNVHTTIGYGSSLAGTSGIHSDPVGRDEIATIRENLGWPADEPFTVPDSVDAAKEEQRTRGEEAHAAWSERLAAYRDAEPTLAATFERTLDGTLPDGWRDALPSFEVGHKEATRATSGTIINALAGVLPELVGGSADLAASNKTDIEDGGEIPGDGFSGRILHFGVREHGMAAAASGMSLHGGFRPFVATFLVFADYLRPSLRLAALMGQPVVYVMTHDSIGLGEDGPTHQPVEHLASLRAIPNLAVVRPADATETAGAWAAAMENSDGPTLMALSRQGLPTLEGTSVEGVANGAYVVADSEGDPDVVIVATGSEVSLAVEARELLGEDGIAARVVSMPCFEWFDQTDDTYQDEVLPSGVPTLSVEMGATFGWERHADVHLGLDRFGASGPGAEVAAHFGFTADNDAAAASALLDDGDDTDDNEEE